MTGVYRRPWRARPRRVFWFSAAAPQAPAVTAGTDRPVVRSGQVGLDVTATPPGGQTITGYSWVIVSGGGSLANPTTATPTYTAPGSGSGVVTVEVTATASGGGQATDTMLVSYHANVVAAENQLGGTARGTWDLPTTDLGGIPTLQGFCDGFSVNTGTTATFKIAQSDGAGWSAQVYRLGYYAGDGARHYANLTPTAQQVTDSQNQPAPGDADPDTTKLSASCANWSTTLTWTVPAWAPSGIYVLRLNRTGGGASHVLLVVRDDARTAALMLMPADTTWMAYNAFGGMGSSNWLAGNSLYFGTALDQYNADCARYVSHDRPVVNRQAAVTGVAYGAVEWSTFFTGEYPMVRFLERNGVDVKYYSCLDAAGDSAGTHLTGNGTTRGGASAAMFVGHNEYWSNGMRAGWEAAKTAGVHVFSCAGNEVFWRMAGAGPDGDGRPRVFECQKSTIGGRGGTRPEWTGTWRDPDGAGKGGNDPENRLTGTIFVVNGPDLRALVVPFNGGYSAQPLWRHTTVADLTSGQTWTSPAEVLGFEWDTYGPAGVSTTASNYLAAPHAQARYCSTVTYSISSGLLLTDAGDVYDAAGTATHRLVVHPGGRGGIVFGTGTVNWALGVDSANTYQLGADNTSVVIQQATVNMLTDMGAPPVTLMAGLTQPAQAAWFQGGDGAAGLASAARATKVATGRGQAAAGLAAAARAVKVAAAAGSCSVGAVTTGRATRVAPATGTALVALATTATAGKTTPTTGTAAAGLATAARARKTAPHTAAGHLTATGAAQATKTAPTTATAALAVVGFTTSALTRAAGGLLTTALRAGARAGKTTAQAGACPAAAPTTARAGKTATTAGTSAAGLAGTAGATHTHTAGATCAAGATTTGTATKTAPQAATAPLGLASHRSGVVARDTGGHTSLGTAPTGRGRKLAPTTAAALVALATTATAGKTATPTAAAAALLTPRGAATKTAAPSGAAFLPTAATGRGSRTTPQRGATRITLTTTGATTPVVTRGRITVVHRTLARIRGRVTVG